MMLLIKLCIFVRQKKNFNKIFNIGNPKEPITMMRLSKLIKKELKSFTKLLPTEITSGSISNRLPFLNKSLYQNVKLLLKGSSKYNQMVSRK